MKRRVVRIAAGSGFVLVWIVAGAYALWGRGSGDADAELSAQEMSAKIAAANPPPDHAAATTPDGVQQAVAMEEVGDSVQKPAADPLFSPGRSLGSSFQPGAGSSRMTMNDAPPTTEHLETPNIVLPQDTGNAYSIGDNDAPTPALPPDPRLAPLDQGDQPPPEDDVAVNPLRSRSVYGVTDDAATASAAADTAAGAHPDAPHNVLPGALPGAPPASFGGTNRLSTAPPSEFNAGPLESEVPVPAPAPQPFPREPAYGAADKFGASGDSGYEAATAPPPVGQNNFGAGAATNNYGAAAGVAAIGTAAALASARPGEAELEGTQAPSLVIEKLAPPEIQVGKPANFEIHVRNAGQTAAQHVTVTDRVPAGTKLVEAQPQPEAAADGALRWKLGTLEAGQSQVITIVLMPQEEGEIGSVAQVTFAAAASAKTVSTRPLLAVEHTAPTKVMIGEPVNMTITITNPGTGVATGVILQEDVPEGLTHSAGKELEYEVGTLRPGESRKLELTLQADKAGVLTNTINVRGDASLTATHSVQIEVVAPQLAVEMSGPKRRYLDRQATYTVSIANAGTAAARDVEIVAYLPKGMKFVSTDHQGQYDPQHHAVFWSLEELPAAQQGSASLVALPVEPGEHKLRVEGRAQLGLTTSDEELVLVEAFPQLEFTVHDEADPIEVGAETIYQVRVTNTGSKAATNIQVAAALPPELRPVSADGATRGVVEGQNIFFEPLGSLAPGAEVNFKVHATGLRTGDYTIRVQIASDELHTPVTKEEHTRVYADR
jgi:uncharacterized repeat protein (TIGR01451 family)